MCDCNEKKECCGCLRGGCDCICECACHKAADDPCSTFPSLTCPDCVAERETGRRRGEEFMKEYGRVPTDAEILAAFRGREIL